MGGHQLLLFLGFSFNVNAWKEGVGHWEKLLSGIARSAAVGAIIRFIFGVDVHFVNTAFAMLMRAMHIELNARPAMRHTRFWKSAADYIET
jgi:hypothetical protein